MRAAILGGWLFVVGCSAPLPDKPSAAPLQPVAVPQIVASCSSEPPPERGQGPNRCLPNGLPEVAEQPEAVAGATCEDRGALERRWAAKLVKSYERVADGRVDVAFGCDAIKTDVSEIVVETGYGHGGSLQVWRLSRRAGPDRDFDVVGVAHRTFYGRSSSGNFPLIARGRIAGRDLDAALDNTRVLLTASLREIEPPPLPGMLGSISGFGSSGNFHHFIRLRDDYRHQLSGQFTGYPGSPDQRVYLGLRHAMQTLEPLLERHEFERDEPSEELRKWFSAHVVSSWPRLQSDDAWWVRERLLNLAGLVANSSVVPILVSELTRLVRRVRSAPAEKRAEQVRRYLREPLEALASITGWDPRRTDDGAERPLMAAAELAIAECTRGTW